MTSGIELGLINALANCCLIYRDCHFSLFYRSRPNCGLPEPCFLKPHHKSLQYAESFPTPEMVTAHQAKQSMEFDRVSALLILPTGARGCCPVRSVGWTGAASSVVRHSAKQMEARTLGREQLRY